MWHTHPDHIALPSPTDEAGMQQVLGLVGMRVPRALMMILGGPERRWHAWLDHSATPDVYARLVRGDPEASPASAASTIDSKQDTHVWPGGYLGPGTVCDETAGPSWWSRLRIWRHRARAAS
jgi:hypothetical protein